jgi:DNA polymerase I
MEVFFQLLDCDYVKLNSSPIVRVFGKTDKGKTVCVFFENFNPYFYVLPKENSKEGLINFLKNEFKNTVINIEEVEKFLPFCYQKNKTRMLKIFLNDPSKTPLVRDSLIQKGLVENIFEADILFKYRFMVDQKLGGMRWYKVNGEPVSTSTTKTDFCIKTSSIQEVGDRETNLKFLCIDIEIFPKEGGLPDPKKDTIAMISLKFHPNFEDKDSLVLVSRRLSKNYKNVLSFKDEKEMLKEFLRIIDSFDPDIITGYNINNFDFPYILQRLTINKLPKTIGRCSSKQAISRKIGTEYRNSVIGRIVVDVFELIKSFIEKETLLSISFSKMTRLKRYGLDDVAREFLGEGKTLNHKEILKYWSGKEEDIEKVIAYTEQDAKLTLRLLLEKNLLDKYYELAKVSGLLLQDVLDGGESVRVENLLLSEFNKHDFVLPNKPSDEEVLRRKDEREIKSLKGALVLEPEVGLHVNPTIYLDFKSMYPSIFIYYNICPTTFLKDENNLEKIETPFGACFVSKKIREGIIPKIISKLIKERDVVKKLLKISTDENEKRALDAKQEALKRMANAFYGYTGYMRARLYSIEIANAITSCGRFLIQKTKEIVERDKRFKVIYGDTDSLFIKTPAKSFEEAFELGKEIEAKINAEIGNIVTTKIENVFKTLLILTKKRYAGLAVEEVNGQSREIIIMKGIETVRRDWCDLTSKTLYNVLEILLKEQNPKKVFDFVKDVIKKIERNEIPIEDLVVTKSISKPLSTYKGVQPHVELVKKIKKRAPAEAPAIGDRVGYVIVQGPQLVSERAEDPEYVKAHNLKIDSRYYIESQILPPLERVFDVLGIKKSELLGVGKQALLADIIKKEEKAKKILSGFDGIICSKCLKTYRRIPLLGKCLKCGGELLFYSGTETARCFAYEPS